MPRPRWIFITLVIAIPWMLFAVQPRDDQPAAKPDQTQPLTPAKEKATFQLEPGFVIELAAAEPQVVDPVAFCFDAREDLYVVEMRGYPNGGLGEGKPNLTGRVKKLQDRDGDGVYETATIFLDQLRFPCAITPWRNGFLIGDAPDLLYAEDTDGDGRADVRKVLYTGFGPKNIQQMINGLQFHFDNWIHGCNGGNDSPVRSLEKTDSPLIQLRGMHFRFKPDVPGSLEPTSGGGQYGLAVTEGGDWLTCTNSQHIRHIVLPHHYLRRNPNLAVPAVTLDIADHGAACKVHRISPFETWRVERTTRRAGSSDAKRFPATELVPGGYVTSGTGIAVWKDRRTLPAEYQGNAWVCDPANNLIHRDILVPSGSTFRASRPTRAAEFLASTDTWFRPVFLGEGPDGSLYVADFYREIIETPLSLPEDIKARWNLNSRERGRIWRIKPARSHAASRQPTLSEMDSLALVRVILGESHGSWRAATAQRLLLEKPVAPEVQRAVQAGVRSNNPVNRRALWLLQAWGALQPDDVLAALRSDQAMIRRQGLILAEHLPFPSEAVSHRLLALVDDPDGHVRLQAAFTLGSMHLPEAEKARALIRILTRPEADDWLQTAVLSSMGKVEVLALSLAYPNPNISESLLARIAALAGRSQPVATLLDNAFLNQIASQPISERQCAVLSGLGAGYVRAKPKLAARLREVVEKSLHTPEAARQIGILGLLEVDDVLPLAREFLQSSRPPALQHQALRALAAHRDARVAAQLMELWPSWSPAVRGEAAEVLLSRPVFIDALLSAAEAGRFSLRQLDPARRDRLLQNSRAEVRKRAAALLGDAAATPRVQVLNRYAGALELTARLDHGKTLFQKTCATCHQLDGMGHAVGPDLHSALGNKTPAALLIDLIDPNREVDSRYVNYVITTRSGRTLTGMISGETANSVTLRRGEGAEETCLRADIEELQGTGKSLMPENLDEQLSPQDVADLIGYLLSVRSRK